MTIAYTTSVLKTKFRQAFENNGWIMNGLGVNTTQYYRGAQILRGLAAVEMFRDVPETVVIPRLAGLAIPSKNKSGDARGAR